MRPIRVKQSNGEIRKVGVYDDETKTLYIYRKKSKHFMHKIKAWGLDAEIFDQLCESGLKDIILYENESHTKYRVKVKDFLNNGLYLHFKPYRVQIFLKEKHWKEVSYV